VSRADRRGVLRRRSIQPTTEVYIGKEANRVEEAEAGLIHKLGEVLDAYADLRRGPWERLVRPVLKDIPARWLQERTGLSRRTIQRLRNRHSRPQPSHATVLSETAAEFARHRLQQIDAAYPASSLGQLSRCIEMFHKGSGEESE
jgi:hypothetical protein